MGEAQSRRGEGHVPGLPRAQRSGAVGLRQGHHRDVAKARRISRPDAEVLITYVVGIHCPDVR